MMKIEVIVQNVNDAIEAEKLGADRLELVTAIDEGGLTPTFEVMKDVLQHVTIPVQIMIRPHSKSFHYSEDAMENVLTRIQDVISAGGDRIVFGAITEDGTVDQRAIETITRAYPALDITFHKAFDEVTDQIEAYRVLQKYPQIKRILTSGGASNCMEGKNQLKALRELSENGEGPVIMPGAGLSPENIQLIHKHVKADEYHFGRAVRVKDSYDHSLSKHALETIYSYTKNERG